MLDNIEKFYIYREAKRNNQINDKLTVKPNVIFEVLIHKDHPQRVHLLTVTILPASHSVA